MLKTLDYTQHGRPVIVSADAYEMSKADVTPLPTRNMQSWLNDQGMRMVCGADSKLHIRVSPLEAA